MCSFFIQQVVLSVGMKLINIVVRYDISHVVAISFNFDAMASLMSCFCSETIQKSAVNPDNHLFCDMDFLFMVINTTYFA